MDFSAKIKEILSFYESESAGVKTNLARILMAGRLGGTGKLMILPVDQGFEHGPTRSFAVNPEASDPHYHFQLAVEGGFSAYAAPLGMLEAGADTYAGCVPLILKMNSSIALMPKDSMPDQAITASVKDALRLGCVAVGLTIYPGSHQYLKMVGDIKDIVAEAKSYGLAVVIWSYPRGGNISKAGETALDIVSYSAHIAALLGANIIKVKLPTAHVERDSIDSIHLTTLTNRVKYVKWSCFNGRRLVVFSGGEAKELDKVYEEIEEIRLGGGDGSIIGRNTFQRSKTDALMMLDNIVNIYKK